VVSQPVQSGYTGGMSNRGSIRGVVQQSAASAGPSGPPDHQRPSPGRRRYTDPASATVPSPYRPDPPAHQPSRAAQPPEPTAPAPAPARFRRERLPGGTALDGLDEPDTEDSSRFGWRDLIQLVTGIDLGPGKDSAYERALRDRIRTVGGGAFPIAVLNLKGGSARPRWLRHWAQPSPTCAMTG
jgi:chromosome partitioning protein